MLSKYKLNQLYFKDTQFANLMTRRIFNVLLIANPYDAFMLEDDGRIDEKKIVNTPDFIAFRRWGRKTFSIMKQKRYKYELKLIYFL